MKKLLDTSFGRYLLNSGKLVSLSKLPDPVEISRVRLFAMLAGITLLCGAGILLFHHFHAEQGRDAIFYLFLTEKWHQGRLADVFEARPDYWFPPLYFYLSQLLMNFGLSPESAGLIVSMCCGTALPPVVFGLSREVTRRTDISLGAAFLTAINPVLLEMACKVQREMLYLFLAAVATLFLAASLRRKKWFLFSLSGIFTALAFLTRYEMMEFIPVVFLYAFLALLFKHDRWYKVLRNAALFFAFFSITVSLLSLTLMGSSTWVWRTVFDRYFSSGKYPNLEIIRQQEPSPGPAPKPGGKK